MAAKSPTPFAANKSVSLGISRSPEIPRSPSLSILPCARQKTSRSRLPPSPSQLPFPGRDATPLASDFTSSKPGHHPTGNNHPRTPAHHPEAPPQRGHHPIREQSSAQTLPPDLGRDAPTVAGLASDYLPSIPSFKFRPRTGNFPKIQQGRNGKAGHIVDTCSETWWTRLPVGGGKERAKSISQCEALQ
jgi:hypothetical protein